MPAPAMWRTSSWRSGNPISNGSAGRMGYSRSDSLGAVRENCLAVTGRFARYQVQCFNSTSMWASHCSTPGPLHPGWYRQICRGHDPRFTFRIFGTRYRTMPLGTPNLKYLQDEIPGTKSLDPTHVRLASAGICSFPESLCTKGSGSSCSRETFCAALVRG
jgi:hypothetical protein